MNEEYLNKYLTEYETEWLEYTTENDSDINDILKCFDVFKKPLGVQNSIKKEVVPELTRFELLDID